MQVLTVLRFLEVRKLRSHSNSAGDVGNGGHRGESASYVIYLGGAKVPFLKANI